MVNRVVQECVVFPCHHTGISFLDTTDVLLENATGNLKYSTEGEEAVPVLLKSGICYLNRDITFDMTHANGCDGIPGIRPGKRTADYINGVMRRITLVGAVFLGGVAVLPGVIGIIRGDPTVNTTLLISAVGLLIVVGVVVDTMRQLEAQLLMRHYEGFIR